jgi:beta-glucosidase
MNARRVFFLTISCLLAAIPGVSQEGTPPGARDSGLTFETRARALVSGMTLDEKVAQMQHRAPPIPRLGIPAFDWWNEALHGVARNGVATVFPQAIGMASTWNPPLIRREAEVIGTEARAKYAEALMQHRHGTYQGLTFWSPNINIFRDPRWGRGQETYGEDPFLTSRVGVAFVRGLQGDHPKYFKVIATPKHYAVHSGPESLRHAFDARPSLRDLYETYLPAFEACVTEGGAWSIMGAYNRVMGAPCCASDLLLGNILRKQWHFGGYVVSDCGAIDDIVHGHRGVATSAEASAMAVKAGCDLTCGNEYGSLIEAVERKLITEEEINVSVRRLFTARMKLGLFDPPADVPFASIPPELNDTPEHSALALQVARESIVLLKNTEHNLPLPKSLGTIAVIGPNADDVGVLLGNYNGTPSHPVTILDGIRRAAGTARVLYARGSEHADGAPPRLEPVPGRVLSTTEDGRVISGLTGSYYAAMQPEGSPAFVRSDTTVDFRWGNSAAAPGLPADRFSVRWTGVLTPDSTGDYLLGASVDDGFRLYLDGLLFLEDWHNGGVRSGAREIRLVAGIPHDIRLEYYENGGDAIVQLGWRRNSGDPAEQAAALARQADRVVVVLGLTPGLEGEEMDVSLPGFRGGDRTDIALPAIQQRLLERLAAVGKPVTLVLLNGSALAIGWAKEHVQGVIEAWYPGQQGGNAVAEVLFGDYNPGGRLPVTFYASVNDLPPFEDYAMAGRTYRYFSGPVLFPFGHGLSYTTFAYGQPRIVSPLGKSEDTLRVRFPLKNTGDRDGDEVVQAYVRNLSVKGDNEPIKSLKAFQRVHLARGQEMSIMLPIARASLRGYNEKTGRVEVLPGLYEVQVGASSSDIRGTTRVAVHRR